MKDINSFAALSNAVLDQLRKENYKESSITNYRRSYKRIERFMIERGIKNYSTAVGDEFLTEQLSNVESKTGKGHLKCAVRRLNDYFTAKPYRCHRPMVDYTLDDSCFSRYLDDYCNYCRNVRGNRGTTIDAKKIICIRFLNGIISAGCLDISRLSTDVISKVCLSIKNKDNYAVIRQFLSFLFEEGYIRTEMSGIIPRNKRAVPVPSVYTVSEITAIENSIDDNSDEGKRDKAIMLLASRMGIRSGDIARLRHEEIDFESGCINIIQQKNETPLSLKMPEDVRDALAEHIENKRLDIPDDGYVFHSMSAPYGRITTSIIRNMLARYFAKASINAGDRKHGPHALRSSLASSMVNDDVSYEVVRKILGHNNPDVISHYAKVDIERLRLCAIQPPPPTGQFADFLQGRRQL